MPYTRAPIVEAVIDLQANFASQPSLEAVQAISDSVADAFPVVQHINSFAVNLGTDPSGAPLSSPAVSSRLGFKRVSATNDRILQLRVQGFAYSHLPPYSNWEHFTAELWPLWQTYAERLGVESIARVGVRFINRLPVAELLDTDDFLALTPRIPKGVGASVIGYFMQTVLPIDSLGFPFRAVVNSGTEPGRAGHAANLLLDIDVFGEGVFSAELDYLKELVDKLRVEKNRIFEGSITDKYRELIK